jgi:hypothetical protein
VLAAVLDAADRRRRRSPQPASCAIPPAIITPDRNQTSLGALEFALAHRQRPLQISDNLDLMHGVEAFVNAYQAFGGVHLQGLQRCRRTDNTTTQFDGFKVPVLTANETHLLLR